MLNYRYFLIILLLATVPACRNHIKTVTRTSNETNKKELSNNYKVTLTPPKITEARFAVTVESIKKMRVESFQVIREIEFATPYQGWRESYEFISGACLLPASLGSHLVFVFSFGMLPYRYCQRINELAFTGMNPFMNWESSDRVEKTILKNQRKMIDVKEEVKQEPLSNRKISVQLAKMRYPQKTDKNGSFEVKLLEPSGNSIVNLYTRKMDLLLDGSDTVLKGIILPRSFLSKINKAQIALTLYASNPNGKELDRTLKQLEKLGFVKLAYELESQELKKHKNDNKFMQEFNSSQ